MNSFISNSDMKKYLKKISLFLGILFSYFLLNLLVNYLLFSQQDPKIETDIVLCGDSHIQKTIDPDIVKNATNIAQSAEPYSITYLKLKYLLKHNHPDTIIIGFAHHNLSAFNELKLSDDLWKYKMIERAYPLLPQYIFDSRIHMDQKELFMHILREMMLYPQQPHGKLIGSYAPQQSKKMHRTFDLDIKRHFFIEDENAGISELAISMLKNMIELAEEKGIVVYLLGTPLHQKYYQKIPENFKTAYKSLKEELRKKDNVRILDYCTLRMKNTYYLNSDHLNRKGSAAFSKRLRKGINSRTE